MTLMGKDKGGRDIDISWCSKESQLEFKISWNAEGKEKIEKWEKLENLVESLNRLITF